MFFFYVFLLVGIIKDRSNLVGVNRTTGQLAKPKEVGANKVAGDNNNNNNNNSGAAVGRDMAKARTVKQDTTNTDTATVIGTAGINSITTTSIGVNNNRVARLLQLAGKL